VHAARERFFHHAFKRLLRDIVGKLEDGKRGVGDGDFGRFQIAHAGAQRPDSAGASVLPGTGQSVRTQDGGRGLVELQDVDAARRSRLPSRLRASAS